jgi:hypothetical protein|tara:strand:- start:2564 stop:2977 length:414 start_codon:yes stop_codon:yes gene_type:complete
MAAFVMTNASVSIAGTDLSDHVRSVTIDASVNLVDDTAMGDVFQSNAAGLATWSITVELLQDYASSKTDAVLSQLMDIGDTAALVIKPVATSVSSTNPSYSGTGILESYNPVAGTVGDQAMATATFASASALTRATS